MVKAQRPPRDGTAASGPGTDDVAPTGPADARVVPLLRRPAALGRVARCGVVALAAGVLVTGDLGSPDGASGMPGATRAPLPVLSGVSARVLETQQLAAVARAESLALADAALRAAAAARSLSRTPPADVVPPVPDGELTAVRDATSGLPADRAAAIVALESAAQDVASADELEPLQPVADSWDDADGLEELTTWTDPGSTDGVPAGDDDLADDDALDPADLAWDDDPTAGDDLAPDDLAPDEDLAAGSGAPVDPVTGDEPVDGDLPDLDASPGVTDTIETPEAEELGTAVADLEALVRAARAAAGQPVDVLPVGSAAAPVAAAAPTPATSVPGRVIVGEQALTTALNDAAGAVFALSLRVEGATEAAARAEIDAREEAVGLLLAGAQATVAAADALVELEPLPEDERAASAARAEGSVGPPASAARLAAARPRTGASPAVAGLAARWDNGLLPTSTLCPVDFAPNQLLQCDAADALADLNEAYRADFGHDLRLTDSYRTLAGQVAVKAAKGSLAATPGTSNHGWGLAIDVAGAGGLGQFDTPVYLWLKENADEFGWHHPRYMEPGGRGPQEPWHWEFGTD